MGQLSFSSLEHQLKRKRTRREAFLGEMDAVIPWDRLVRLIAPYYRKQRTGRPLMKLERMLRVYFLQQWYQLSDPGAEDALYDSEAMRQFAGIRLGIDAVPDESTIMNFRHLLEEKKLTKKIFEATGEYLQGQGLILQSGTLVDATIIHAPQSRKNASGKTDPEMSSTQKSGQWFFGMKAHIGTDKKGIVHSLVCTTAKVQESTVVEGLLHGKESAAYGDKGYDGKEVANRLKRRFRSLRNWCAQKRGHRNKNLTLAQERRNKRYSDIRKPVEFAFGVVKHLWGYRKTRYRGIEKNAAQLYTLFALSNLFRLRKPLLELAPE